EKTGKEFSFTNQRLMLGGLKMTLRARYGSRVRHWCAQLVGIRRRSEASGSMRTDRPGPAAAASSRHSATQARRPDAHAQRSVRLYAWTSSTMAATASGAVNCEIPWPRLKTWPFPAVGRP